MKMNRDRHGKGEDDHFRGVTKMTPQFSNMAKVPQ
jgi:hypothetical protein